MPIQTGGSLRKEHLQNRGYQRYGLLLGFQPTSAHEEGPNLELEGRTSSASASNHGKTYPVHDALDVANKQNLTFVLSPMLRRRSSPRCRRSSCLVRGLLKSEKKLKLPRSAATRATRSLIGELQGCKMTPSRSQESQGQLGDVSEAWDGCMSETHDHESMKSP